MAMSSIQNKVRKEVVFENIVEMTSFKARKVKPFLKILLLV